jgi:hypothetical protein
MEEMRNGYRLLLENLNGRYHLGDLGVDGRMFEYEGVNWIYLAQDRIQ